MTSEHLEGVYLYAIERLYNISSIRWLMRDSSATTALIMQMFLKELMSVILLSFFEIN